jgi:transposase
VAKASGTVCVRTPHPNRPDRPTSRVVQAGWYVSATSRADIEFEEHPIIEGIERIEVEYTADYWQIWFYVLEAAGVEVQRVNAGDGNNVPGCPKPDKLDAVWLAKLTEKGILRLSSVLPVQVRQLRDYTRLRVDVPAGQGPQAARRRADQYRPWGREDSMSARDTLEALIAGDRDSSLFANLARGKMRPNGQRSPRR